MNELMHYGTKGHSGRYPPGSGENPKTGPRSIYLRAKKAKKKAAMLLSKGKKAKKVKPPKKYLKKPTDEQVTKILNSGDIEQIKKYNRFLSNNEINYALQRIDFDQKINSISAYQKDKGLRKFEEISDKINRATVSMDKIRQGYNRIAAINNSVNPSQLPIFDGNFNANLQRVEIMNDYAKRVALMEGIEKESKKQQKAAKKEEKKKKKELEKLKKRYSKYKRPKENVMSPEEFYKYEEYMYQSDDSWPKLYSSAFEKKEKKTYPW